MRDRNFYTRAHSSYPIRPLCLDIRVSYHIVKTASSLPMGPTTHPTSFPTSFTGRIPSPPFPVSTEYKAARAGGGGCGGSGPARGGLGAAVAAPFHGSFTWHGGSFDPIAATLAGTPSDVSVSGRRTMWRRHGRVGEVAAAGGTPCASGEPIFFSSAHCRSGSSAPESN